MDLFTAYYSHTIHLLKYTTDYKIIDILENNLTKPEKLPLCTNDNELTNINNAILNGCKIIENKPLGIEISNYTNDISYNVSYRTSEHKKFKKMRNRRYNRLYLRMTVDFNNIEEVKKQINFCIHIEYIKNDITYINYDHTNIIHRYLKFQLEFVNNTLNIIDIGEFLQFIEVNKKFEKYVRLHIENKSITLDAKSYMDKYYVSRINKLLKTNFTFDDNIILDFNDFNCVYNFMNWIENYTTFKSFITNCKIMFINYTLKNLFHIMISFNILLPLNKLFGNTYEIYDISNEVVYNLYETLCVKNTYKILHPKFLDTVMIRTFDTYATANDNLYNAFYKYIKFGKQYLLSHTANIDCVCRQLRNNLFAMSNDRDDYLTKNKQFESEFSCGMMIVYDTSILDTLILLFHEFDAYTIDLLHSTKNEKIYDKFIKNYCVDVVGSIDYAIEDFIEFTQRNTLYVHKMNDEIEKSLIKYVKLYIDHNGSLPISRIIYNKDINYTSIYEKILHMKNIKGEYYYKVLTKGLMNMIISSMNGAKNHCYEYLFATNDMNNIFITYYEKKYAENKYDELSLFSIFQLFCTTLYGYVNSIIKRYTYPYIELLDYYTLMIKNNQNESTIKEIVLVKILHEKLNVTFSTFIELLNELTINNIFGSQLLV